MTFKEFRDLAMANYDNGGDIIFEEYDEDDFKEWLDGLEDATTPDDYAYEFSELLNFYKECEDATGVRPQKVED